MTEREQFEAWWEDDDSIFPTHESDPSESHLATAWQAWQASRRAALEEAAKVCDQMVSVSAISYETGSACADAIRALSQHQKGEP